MSRYQHYTDEHPQHKALDLWQRLIARCIDFGAYWLLIYAYRYFAYNRSMGLAYVISLLIIILVEPLMIRFFKTTPGKAVFGIRVSAPGGKRLSFIEAYARTFYMISIGLGFIVIPLYNVYRLYKSYKHYMESGETQWDEGYEYTFKIRNSRLITTTGALCAVVIAAAVIVFPSAAQMPKHRGDITLEQFTENVNRHMHYRHIPESIGMRYDGVYGVLADPPRDEWINPGLRSTSFRRNVAGIDVVETNGFVTEVTLTNTEIRTSNPIFFINHIIYPVYKSFALAQEDIGVLSVVFGDAHRELRSITDNMADWGMSGTHVFIVGAVEVTFNYERLPGTRSDIPHAQYDMYFSMKK